MESSKSIEWTVEDKQKFVTGVSENSPFRTAGNINWLNLSKSIGKSVTQVKEFAKTFNALENGMIYPEFSSKAAIDVWRQLAESATNPDDDIADVCVPQVLTVAALEPVASSSESADSPNYGNIYSYLSAVTRDTNVQDLPPEDAVVILDLLTDLIQTLSQSESLIQREFMHNRYAEMRHMLPADEIDTKETQSEDKHENKQKYFSSNNPYGIPFQVLEFKTNLQECKKSSDE